MERKYTLRYPVRLLADRPIDGIDGASIDLNGIHVSFRIEKPYLIVTAQDFLSEDEALSYVLRLRIGFYKSALDNELPFSAATKPDQVVYCDDPRLAAKNLAKSVMLDRENVDGMVNGNLPCAYPSGSSIVAMYVGDVRVTLGTPLDRFLSSLKEGVLENHPEVLEHSNVATAMDLFVSTLYERLPGARLITLMTVLECLAPVSLRHPAALEVIERLRSVVRCEEVPKGSEEAKALEDLMQGLGRMREPSKRSRVRNLVKRVMTKLGHPEPEAEARRIVAAYDTRSNLVHEGSVDGAQLNEAVDVARRTVPKVLAFTLKGGALE